MIVWGAGAGVKKGRVSKVFVEGPAMAERTPLQRARTASASATALTDAVGMIEAGRSTCELGRDPV